MNVINACKPPPREMKKCSLSNVHLLRFCGMLSWRFNLQYEQRNQTHAPSLWAKKKKKEFLRKKNETTHTLSAGFWLRLCPTLLHWPHTKAFYIYRTLCSRATGSRAWTKSCKSPTVFIPLTSWIRSSSPIVELVARCNSRSCHRQDRDGLLFISTDTKQVLNILSCFSSTATFSFHLQPRWLTSFPVKESQCDGEAW